MAGRIVLISDDADFFDFIKHKLELRNSDELFTFNFREVPDIMHILESAVLIVNAENSQNKTLDLLKIFNYRTLIVVVSYNDDESFKKKCYKYGAIDFISLLISDSEFRARMLPLFNLSSILEKNKQYRNILVKNKILDSCNEVYLNYENVIDNAIIDIANTKSSAIFGAISPVGNEKFLLKSNYIETIILNNIRKNDILMCYAPNKYYLILKDIKLVSAQRLWSKISKKFNNKLFAGFVQITNQSRQQLINAALNNLHEVMNQNHDMDANLENEYNVKNFKQRRNEYEQKLAKIILPAFYRVQQKYLNKLTGVKIEQSYSDGQGYFNVIGNHYIAEFLISSPGFLRVNIDVTLKETLKVKDSKRISFNINEFDECLLQDLLEQFMFEVKKW